MRTSVLLAILAAGAVVAFAGVAAAESGAGILSMENKDNSGQGMMTRNGGCHGDGGQFAQYRYDGECPGDCQVELMNNYSWSYGEGNMTCACESYQNQAQGGQCSGTCDSCNDWHYNWDWDYNYGGQ